MERLLHLLLGSAQAHPQLALAIIGLVALAESLAIVGTLVPAAVVMVAGGALIGQGVIGMGPTMLVAMAGAIVGDALSFELGRRYQRSIRASKLYQRHRSAVYRSETFIDRHGALSVLLARFTGAIRAFVPLIAGFGRMPRWRFYMANVGSAMLWAPAHLLPGMLFGSSLQLAEAISGRLAMMVLVLATLLVLAVWGATRGVRKLAPLLQKARQRAIRWASGRPGHMSRLFLDLIDPGRPGSQALLLGALLLLGGAWLFLGVLQDILVGDPLVQVDVAVQAFFQSLRTAPMDRLMVLVTETGGPAVLLSVIATVALWLFAHRDIRTLRYWLGSVAVAELLVKVLKLSLGRERPGALYDGIESFSFPSGHTTMSAVVFGFLAFLISRGRARWVRSLIVAVTASEVALVALSRLYLGAHWMSDVIAGASLGLVWVAFCSMVYVRRHVDEVLHVGYLAVLVASIVVGATGYWHWRHGAADLAFHATRTVEPHVVQDGMPADGWPGVPRRRREMDGDLEEPFGVQLACQRDDIVRMLQAAGWRPAAAWQWQSVLGTLAGVPLGETPVLTRFDRGQPDAFSLVRSAATNQRQVLRLWRSSAELRSGGQQQPVWYGALYEEHRQATGALKGWMHLTGVESSPASLAHSLGVMGNGSLQVKGDRVLLVRCASPSSRNEGV